MIYLIKLIQYIFQYTYNRLFITIKSLPLIYISYCGLTIASDLNDAHIHYNKDVWPDLSPQQAINMLSEQGIQRAIVFSTPAEGTEKLYKLAPQRVIPFLMPYRVVRDRFTWHSDPTMPEYVKQQLSSGIYHGFGEFHLLSKHKDTPVIKQLMQIIADNNLVLSAHADAETVEHLISLQPGITVIWAHCGMDQHIEDVKRMLTSYSQLYCDLSFRYNMFDADNNILPEWKALLDTYASRFMLGMDTYIPRRWASLDENVDFARSWLEQLKPETRQRISKDNVDNLFPVNATN